MDHFCGNWKFALNFSDDYLPQTIKDYKKMSWEAKKKVAEREKEEAYVRKLKEVIDLKNEKLQKQIKEQHKK